MSFWKFLGRLAFLNFFFDLFSSHEEPRESAMPWNNQTLGLDNDGIDECDYFGDTQHYSACDFLDDSTDDFDYSDIDDCDYL